MGSLLWKGSRLERAMGGARFAKLVAWCVVASHALVVALAWLARDAFPAQMHSCAVGFSAVLFALKARQNEYAPDNRYDFMDAAACQT